MFLTESEAEKKWCPLGRMRSPSGAFNRVPPPNFWERVYDRLFGFMSPKNVSRNCLGSKCAVWRWADAQRGYCGLAGTPMAERVMREENE
jgi:hypothetical protein